MEREDIEAVRAENALLKRRVAALRRNIDDQNVEIARVHELLAQYMSAHIDADAIIHDDYLRAIEYQRADREATDIVAMLMDENNRLTSENKLAQYILGRYFV